MLPWFELTTVYIGPIPLQVWGFWVALGFVLSTVILTKRLKPFGIKADHVLDFCIWLLVGGFIGARVFHVVFYEPTFFIQNPGELLKIWHGGLSSFGGFAGAAAGFWLFKKRRGFGWMKKLSPMGLFDQFSFAALYGWMIGRVGCFMIHDHLGVPCDCALALNKPDGPRLDMALLEILALLPLALVFFLLRKKKHKEGFFASILLVYYGIVRFILDFWRATDIIHADARYAGLTPAQYISIAMVAYGVYLGNRIRTQ